MIGFSTGCLYRNIEPISKKAIKTIASTGCDAIELCAGLKERIPTLSSIGKDDLANFKYISLHAPCDISYGKNEEALNILKEIEENNKRLGFDCIVIHANNVTDWSVFSDFDLPFAFENIDKGKGLGETVEDMKKVFSFVNFKMVLDLTHAYTVDPSMELAKNLYKEFKERIFQIHLSGYYCHGEDSQQHYPINITKQEEILNAVKLDKTVIIESALPNYMECDKTKRIKDNLDAELKYVKDFISNKII